MTSPDELVHGGGAAARARPARRAPVVVVRDLRDDDVTFAVAGHRAHLPNGFFVRLGPRFLAAYYRGFVASPHAVALLAEVDGERVGALVGSTCQASHYRWLVRRRGVALGVRGVAALLVRPGELRRFLQGRLWRYVRGIARMVRGRVARQRGDAPVVDLADPSAGRGASPTSVAVLHHVFVTPEAGSSGVGSELLARFEAASRAAGAREARLVTVADDEGHRSAAGFYERAGWARCDRRRDRDGRLVIELEKPLR